MKKETAQPRRFDRGAVLHLVLMLPLLGFAAASTLYRFTLPTDGWLAAEPTDFKEIGLIYQKNLIGAASGLLPGDRLVAVEGLPLERGQTALWGVSPTWGSGKTVQYTVQRGEQELQIEVSLVRWDLWRFLKEGGITLQSLVSWVSFFLFLVIGFITFWLRPGEPAARALWVMSAVWFSISTVMNILPGMLPDRIDPLASLCTFLMITATFTVLAPPTLIRFALVFPQPKPSVQRHPWVAFLPYGVGVIGIGAFLVQFFVFGFAWTGLSVLIAIGILIHNALTMRDAVSQAQLRWGLGGMIAGLGIFFLIYIPLIINVSTLVENVLGLIGSLGFGVMGAALGIAVLRYRLWDIDVIIRKTLVYSVLTGLLALVYFGSVLLLQGVFSRLGSGQSPAVSVLSTLAIAALFNPLRRRVQQVFDRRFYRKKYDAEQILASFSAEARDEVEIDKLSAALVGAVEETVQPEEVSVWLRNIH